MFDDLTSQGRLFQTDGAARKTGTKKDLCPSECVRIEGRQRMELLEEERNWQVGLSFRTVLSVDCSGGTVLYVCIEYHI